MTGRTVAAVIAAAVLGAGVLGAGLSAPAPAAAQGAIDWHPCVPEPPEGTDSGPPRHDIRCADVTVPVDHSAPDGRTITVSVTWIPSTGSRVGAVFGNPGGPGQDARRMWWDALDTWNAAAIDTLNRTHDLVVVQPRGLEGSGAIDCAVHGGRSDLDAVTRACYATDPDLVRSFTTENLVRDTDHVRALMGLDSISYFGNSYGTAVGMVYQALFPERLDRLVLDSSVGPSEQWWRANEAVNQAGRGPARDWYLDWIARNDAVYGLGDTAHAVYSRLRAIDVRSGDLARRYPPPDTGSLGSADPGDLAVRLDNAVGALTGRYSGQADVPGAVFTILDDRVGFPVMWSEGARFLADIVHSDSPEEAAALLEDALEEGPLVELEPDPSFVATQRTSDDGVYLTLLRCNENQTAPVPGALAGSEVARALGSSEDVVRSLRWSGLPCPIPATSVPPATRANPLGSPPLILQSDDDPFTPGSHGPATARATGGVLVRVRGPQHALFHWEHPGVDAIVLEYLLTGRAPAGLHLPAAPPPVAW